MTDELIVGCTFAGLGRAFARPAGCLVVESAAGPGGEWIEAFDPAGGWSTPSREPRTETLRQEMIRRGVIAGDRVHLPGLVPVLAGKLLESGVRFLFLTDVAAVRVSGAGFEVDLAGSAGLRTVRVARLFDTTTRAITRRPDMAPLRAKRLHAALNRAGDADPTGPLPEGPGYRVVPGLFPREGWLVLDVPPDTGWAEARERLRAFWVDRPAPLRGWDLHAIAERFAETPERAASPAANWTVLQSRLSTNPLAAFEAGARSAAGEGAP